MEQAAQVTLDRVEGRKVFLQGLGGQIGTFFVNYVGDLRSFWYENDVFSSVKTYLYKSSFF